MNVYSGVFEVTDYESQDKKWRIEYGGQVHAFFYETLTILLWFASKRLPRIFGGYQLRIWSQNLKI